ncbi:MAG: HlyD family efflux transporter periplasmic adaptor subunit [Planctomycetes bacterium]|nr:HlyD family efflux transporter periplasmic adaptor subunit [Planctomycetota bacterium]
MMRSRNSHPRGNAVKTLVGVICVVAIVGAAFAYLRQSPEPDSGQTLLLHTVEQSDFNAFVTEPGDVASSSNVEVRCRVKSRGAPGTPILRICDEGTNVKEGDFLIQFDDSVLQNELLAQKIVVANDKALLIQAESDLKNAQRTLTEFDEGLFQQELELLESELFVAEEELRKSELATASSKRLAARGLINTLQVTAAKFAFEKAKKDVDAATRKVDVFKRFTREKMSGEYEAEIAKQEANVEAATFTLKLSEQKLAETQQQIEYCLVNAPAAGQVVHANERDGRGDTPEVMEEGTIIRENQVVIRLPDLTNMQVDVNINESHVNRIKPGQIAEIELDADPDKVLHGEVKEIAAYPIPIRWHGAPMEYGVTVRIMDPPPTIRPGLRAKVKVFFESKSQVLQVPLAAVVEHDERHFCLVREEQGWRTQSIQLGSNNNTHVVVEEGLVDGDQVALTPFRHIKRSDLPDAAPIDIASDRKVDTHPIKAASSTAAAIAAPAS